MHKTRKIHSFDLVKYNQFITQCDIKNVPLEDKSVDIAIFCLSLMGINFVDFIKEASRILKTDGILIVAEIVSRIVSIDNFIHIFELLGFKLFKEKNIKNYFALFVFRLQNKTEKIEFNNDNFEILKPCLYKKR